MKCLTKIGNDNVLDIFTKFYDIPSKNEQDLYFQGLIDWCRRCAAKTPKHRSWCYSNGLKEASFSYHLLLGAKRKNVYLSAFLSVYFWEKSSKNSFIKAERNGPHRQNRENYQPFFDPRKSFTTKCFVSQETRGNKTKKEEKVKFQVIVRTLFQFA